MSDKKHGRRQSRKQEHKHSQRYGAVKRRSAPGAQPGTLIIDPDSPAPRLHLLAYGPAHFEERELAEPQLVSIGPEAPAVTWLDIEGLGDLKVMHALGQHFGLHPLALEDVINVHQRPKVDTYPDMLFVVARMCLLQEQGLETEQVCFFLGAQVLLSFQEGRPGDCFEPVRQRLRKNLGTIRQQGADYLTYALLDSLIDHYFPLLETYGNRLEALEDAIMLQPHKQMIAEIHAIRRDLQILRRAIWPLREVLSALMRDSNTQFSPEAKLHLRDCYDHVIQLMDFLETYRDLSSSLMEVYLSSMSQRMNEIMQFLTMVSTIFIPLTLIAGIYGMNFQGSHSPWNMPELEWYYGYPFALGLMLFTALGLLYFFRRRGWLGLPRSRRRSDKESV